MLTLINGNNEPRFKIVQINDAWYILDTYNKDKRQQCIDGAAAKACLDYIELFAKHVAKQKIKLVA
jgi:hypothetical protein